LAGWPNCCQVSNGFADLIFTTDIGPRILHFGFVDQENELVLVEETVGLTGRDSWRLYEGHRLWHAPEAAQRSYVPDNDLIQVEETDN
jgi:hypothetical protein